MEENKKQKIEKYHFEEIIYILLILSSNLSTYDEDELVNFTEDIEGRVDELFSKDFLLNLNKIYGIDDIIIKYLEEIKEIITAMYEPQWHTKLKEKSNISLQKIKTLSTQVLEKLKFEYISPLEFSKEYLNIDW